MPKIEELKSKQKKFKKREYRPYNLIGDNLSQESPPNTSAHINNNQNDQVHDVDPNIIKNWKFHDRPLNELGDIDALAEEFKNVG